MKWRTAGMGAVLLGGVGMAGGVAAQERDDDFRWSAPMEAGRLLEVQGITGNIRAEAASGRTAEVMAVKTGRGGDFHEVEVRVVETRDGYRICAVYHPHRNDDGDCDSEWHDDDRGWGRDRDADHRRSVDVEVDYVVKLPAGVDFEGTMVSGDIHIEDVRSEVEATTVSGDVYITTSEVARATTVSGSVEVAMGSTDWNDLDFQTVNGDITLWLPRNIDARVAFSSLSGDIDSDFDLGDQGRNRRQWVGRTVRGVIGEGGSRRLSLKTVSGDVRLKYASR
ncbi:MAG: DUF4097 domain-containing protein [Gemmatimonadota bacterium]|nr:DUF4097 domain-containing protein [Gemmatimonadota bacterium]MDH5758316.1 DUF4097 domain-containing protein [Gemmatimonadota bacterium]